jgi:hypothetical protein
MYRKRNVRIEKMATKRIPLKQVMKDHKLNDGKACRRKLRAAFKNHTKGERWEFTAKELPKILTVLGVTKEKPKKAKRATKPAQPPAIVSKVSTPEVA